MIELTKDVYGNKMQYIGTLRTRQDSNRDMWDCHLYIRVRRYNRRFTRFYIQIGEDGIINMPADYQPVILDAMPDIRKYQRKQQSAKADTSKRVRRVICRDKQCTELHQQAQAYRARQKLT